MLAVKSSQPVKKVMKMQVHMMSPLSSFFKFLSLGLYQSKMNAFARLVNHGKQVRLQRDILKRFISTAQKQRKELKKFVLGFWLKKVSGFRLRDSQLFVLFNKLGSYRASVQKDALLAIRGFALSKATIQTESIEIGRKVTAVRRKRAPNNRHVHNLSRVLSYIYEAHISKAFLALKRIQPKEIDMEGVNVLHMLVLRRMAMGLGAI